METLPQMDLRPANGPDAGALPSGSMSLEGMHGSVEVPHDAAGFWRQWRAFVGPAVLVSVGYMDPGNWGTATCRAGRSSSSGFCGWSAWRA